MSDTREGTAGVGGTGGDGGSSDSGCSSCYDCADNDDCPPTEFCAQVFGGCGPDVGKCSPLPQSCPEEYEPICGCDGNVYDNRCEALAARTLVVGDFGRNTCTPPSGMFPCGSGFCESDSHYCHLSICEPLPTACMQPDADCSCFGIDNNTTCSCEQSGGGYYITCVVP